MTVASPAAYRFNPEIEKYVMEIANETNSQVIFIENPEESVKGVHVVSSNKFISLGDEAEQEKRFEDFKGNSVTKALIKAADANYIFLHYLS